MLKKIEGIVIKARDYGETHKLLTLYTKDAGKITAICRGANKTKSRLSAVSQPFIKAEYQMYMTKGLSTIQQGEMLQSYRHIREDIVKTAYAALMMELIDKLMDQRNPDVYIYRQLETTMEWLNDHDTYMVPIMMFELKMYRKAGFAPVVSGCAACGNENPPYTFSIREGGFLCPDCSTLDPHRLTIPAAFFKLLPLFLEVGLERIGNISVKPENIQYLRKILDHYYEQHGSYTLKSKRFLAQLDKLS